MSKNNFEHYIIHIYDLYYEKLLLETINTSNPMETYHNYSELTEFLQTIATDYPNITNLFTIGQSVQGRELWVMNIQWGPILGLLTLYHGQAME